jgi:hypothetical protein
MRTTKGSPMADQPQWQLEGDYFEACNCESTCPCIFLADPDEGDCQATLAWHVRRGHFGTTSLDGLNVAGIFHTPGNMLTGPKWRAALYIDERADADQAAALEQIFSGQVGGFWANIAPLVGEQLGVRRAPMEFDAEGRRRRLTIPGALDVQIEATPGGDSERESLVTNPALYGAPGFDPVISRSTRYTVHDHGIDWDNTGRNAFYSGFKYNG